MAPTPAEETTVFEGIRCLWMRGGTSKGGYFLAEDLPDDRDDRDAFLLRAMGSPDPRQIDGMGGADPLTSKVAVVKRSERPGIDVDYLFLQVVVDRAIVTDAQNCGNILAGVGPFAIERGLVPARDGETNVTIYMENTGQVAEASVATPGGRVTYRGGAVIDGVPGSAAAVPVLFRDTAGSSCGALLPTGNTVDEFDGVPVTCIDNGMPVVVIRAADLGVTGTETREQLDADTSLKAKLESIRLQAGPRMNLGDVRDKTVPKMTLVSPAQGGGTISTRTFIPHRCHASIGVLGAVSVATACALPESPAAALAVVPDGRRKSLSIEHPTGEMTVVLDLDDRGGVARAAILRTARKLFDGVIFAD
ncbi:4-oxalomesaconate tautomerase [Azospirillum doebereinerae]|uniref:4-oxalomesaconate tautomerase n=1 Tax=Azospirillum doebereinerae TaxID=92933 RepID=A0A3S1CEM2_9PROT|nr:4-oxalomesaconate tautomerase [Azospirillum doebereinerae]MCG5243377.1 4-oxalomesaconate tautomerase [Azospirillum doebereinerae]RUQ66332.1 4-oxalomesaconate tautomerase [Azospirillum doebereinerae]